MDWHLDSSSNCSKFNIKRMSIHFIALSLEVSPVHPANDRKFQIKRAEKKKKKTVHKLARLSAVGFSLNLNLSCSWPPPFPFILT